MKKITKNGTFGGNTPTIYPFEGNKPVESLFLINLNMYALHVANAAKIRAAIISTPKNPSQV